MNPNLEAKKDKVIDLINNLEDGNFALLLLIHISRYQNLFLHTEPDWENSPNNWIIKDRRLQDESIGVLSFIILYSLTNAHVDESLFPEHRKQIKAMRLEDFLDNNFFVGPYKKFIGKKISLKVLEAFFSIPRENIRRYINSLIEAGFISKDKKYGYLVDMDAFLSYQYTDSLSKIMKSLMKTFDDILVNLEEKYQLKLNLNKKVKKIFSLLINTRNANCFTGKLGYKSLEKKDNNISTKKIEKKLNQFNFLQPKDAQLISSSLGKNNEILLRYIYQGNNVLVVLDTKTKKIVSIITLKKDPVKW